MLEQHFVRFTQISVNSRHISIHQPLTIKPFDLTIFSTLVEKQTNSHLTKTEATCASQHIFYTIMSCQPRGRTGSSLSQGPVQYPSGSEPTIDFTKFP